MMRDGASTLNARTAYELTVTLPNHTSMVTGRKIARSAGGHGVTWNDDRLVPATVQEAAGGPVESVFSIVHGAGRETALFATKTKFSLWQRSWPDALDRYEIREDADRVVARDVRRDVRDFDRAFTFVHLGHTDVVGHARGWMSPAYLDAVRAADGYVGRILDAIASAGETGETLVVVTADHGGRGRTHANPAVVRRLPDPLPGRRTRRAGGDRPLRPQPRLPRPRHRPADVPAEEAADPQRRRRQPRHRRARDRRRSRGARSTRSRTSRSSRRTAERTRQSASRTDPAGWSTMAAWTRTTTPSGWSAKRSRRAGSH